MLTVEVTFSSCPSYREKLTTDLCFCVSMIQNPFLMLFLLFIFQPSSDVQSARSAATRIPVSKGMKPSSKAVLGVSTVTRLESRAESHSMKIELRKSTICGSASTAGGKIWATDDSMWTSHNWVCRWICCQILVTGHIHTQTGLWDVTSYNCLAFQTLLYLIQIFSLHLHMILCQFKGRFFRCYLFLMRHLFAWLTSSWWYLAVALDLLSSFTFFIACVYFTAAFWRFPVTGALWIVCDSMNCPHLWQAPK